MKCLSLCSDLTESQRGPGCKRRLLREKPNLRGGSDRQVLKMALACLSLALEAIHVMIEA